MAVTVTPQSGLKVNVGLGATRVVTTQTTSAKVGTSLDDLSSVDTSGVQAVSYTHLTLPTKA